MDSRPGFHCCSTWQYSWSTSSGSAKKPSAEPRNQMRPGPVIARIQGSGRSHQTRSKIYTSRSL
jgi:hypothetical protein